MRWDCRVIERNRKRCIKQVYKLRKEEDNPRKLFYLFDNIPAKLKGTIHEYVYVYRHIVLEVNKSFFQKLKDWFKK